MSDWRDPDDAPVITYAIAKQGEWRMDCKVVKPATKTLLGADLPASLGRMGECSSKPFGR
jgi:hypothetical protein